MSRFYIGQRVRLVAPVHTENAGREGVIFDLFESDDWDNSNCLVTCLVDGEAVTRSTHTDGLEPILQTPTIAEILEMENLPPDPIRELVHVRAGV